ncbi:hypothetical protein [uncultured Martelella sp.]|uniref:hypothetical protein n=1 Tax=uncultured Martelella sp. TaxID=392331 RepID=UPI0029C98936|nr:hypothetical protein [uncultured Martelella sp.]
MALFAIVFSSWFSQPAIDEERRESHSTKKTNQDRYVNKPVSSEGQFDPWRDSYAQWAMAIVSVAATGFSIWAVFLVKDTLVETRKSVRAANDAVAETRRFGEVQERPWLTLQFKIDGDIARNEREWSTSIITTVKNIGKTTALDVTVDAKLVFWPIFPDIQNISIQTFGYEYQKDKDFPIPGPMHIFPNETESIQRGVRIQIDEVENKKWPRPIPLNHFAIFVCVSYRTVLDQEDTPKKLTVIGRDIYKFRDGSDLFIDLFRGEQDTVAMERLILRPPIGKSAIIT